MCDKNRHMGAIDKERTVCDEDRHIRAVDKDNNV